MSYLAKKDYDKIMIDKSLKKLGLFMPMLSLTVAVLFLIYKKDNFSCLIIFYILNLMLNQTLKHWIKEPRPIDANHNAVIKSDSYGMPSGHAQTVSFVFIYLLLKYPKNPYIFIIGLLALLITTRQRIIDKKHTPNQVNAGLLVGSMFAIITHMFF